MHVIGTLCSKCCNQMAFWWPFSRATNNIINLLGRWRTCTCPEGDSALRQAAHGAITAPPNSIALIHIEHRTAQDQRIGQTKVSFSYSFLCYYVIGYDVHTYKHCLQELRIMKSTWIVHICIYLASCYHILLTIAIESITKLGYTLARLTQRILTITNVDFRTDIRYERFRYNCLRNHWFEFD